MLGHVSGKLFGPNENITRVESATIIWKTAQFPSFSGQTSVSGQSGDFTGFGAVSNWDVEAIMWNQPRLDRTGWRRYNPTHLLGEREGTALRFFSGDNILFRTCEQLFDLMLLSVIWAMLCVPVITIGPATTALYYSVVKCVRHNETGTLLNFWTCFKQNFKVGAIAGSITLAVLAALLLSYHLVAVMVQEGDVVGNVLYYAERVLLVVILGLALWLAPILSRFTVGVKELFLTAVQVGVKHLPTTIAVSLLFAVVMRVTMAFISPLLLAPGLCALVISFFYERVLKQYMPGVTEENGDGERPWYLQ